MNFLFFILRRGILSIILYEIIVDIPAVSIYSRIKGMRILISMRQRDTEFMKDNKIDILTMRNRMLKITKT
jgi:hypothetical protein